MEFWRQVLTAISAPWQGLISHQRRELHLFTPPVHLRCNFFYYTLQRMTGAIMAFVDTISSAHVLEDPELPPRKRFKTSELPINATQKSTIDGLLNTIKKKGEYDLLRKKVWSQFEESVCLLELLFPKVVLHWPSLFANAIALGREDSIHNSTQRACRSRN